MSLFLDPSEILEQNSILNYINYENINEDQKEFLRTDLWHWEWITTPAAVYFPGQALWNTRCIAITPNFNNSLGEITGTIRGYNISQYVGIDSAGTISFTILDREDQAMSIFIKDWQEKLTCMDNKFTYRKEDTVASGVLTLLNSSRIPIRKWKCLTCQPTVGAPNPNFDSQVTPSQNGEFTFDLHFEHHRLIWTNLPE